MLLIDQKLTIGPSSRPLAPRSCDPGRLIARKGTPIGWQRFNMNPYQLAKNIYTEFYNTRKVNRFVKKNYPSD